MYPNCEPNEEDARESPTKKCGRTEDQHQRRSGRQVVDGVVAERCPSRRGQVRHKTPFDLTGLNLEEPKNLRVHVTMLAATTSATRLAAQIVRAPALPEIAHDADRDMTR